jgi:hypothetical protein
MSITGSMVSWATWVLIAFGLLVAWIALLLVGLTLPGLVRKFCTWLEWRRFWRRNGNYVPDHWERQVRR